MRKLLILTAVVMLLASTVGCQCGRWFAAWGGGALLSNRVVLRSVQCSVHHTQPWV